MKRRIYALLDRIILALARRRGLMRQHGNAVLLAVEEIKRREGWDGVVTAEIAEAVRREDLRLDRLLCIRDWVENPRIRASGLLIEHLRRCGYRRETEGSAEESIPEAMALKERAA